MIFYAISTFLSAFLLFQVEPMMGKYLLPWFGGTPAVWSTLLLFFQVVLLGGYAYSFWLRKRPRRIQGIIHVILLLCSLAALIATAGSWSSPITPGNNWRPEFSAMPVGAIFKVLFISIFLPFFVLSANSTLMQSWFNDKYGRSPYWLYALSNCGSLLGLISYPFLIEPLLTLQQQGWIWSSAYAAFAVALSVLSGLTLIRRMPGNNRDGVAVATKDETAANTRTVTYLLWVVLPAIASVMLLAVTNQITQEVAAIPFLWILPLSLYLVSFILTFSNRSWYHRTLFIWTLGIASVLYFWVLAKGPSANLLLQIAIYSLLIFVVCMVCHGELIRLRPSPSHLTSFYLTIAAGGAIGGIFVNLVAPYVFSGFWELPLGVLASWILLTILYIKQSPGRAASQAKRLYFIRAAELGCLTLIFGILSYAYIRSSNSDALYCGRNYYGVLRVNEMNAGKEESIALFHGATLHGFQFVANDKRRIPTAYFSEQSGIGYAISSLGNGSHGLRIGVLGEGVGTLAAYARPADTMRFYEINPLVARVAAGTDSSFSFIDESPAKIDVILGDARISLERELAQGQPQHFDLLAMDAFSSDSVPVHLLTKEAFAIYLQHLKQDGLLAINITNRSLDLLPVVQKQAQNCGLDLRLLDSTGDGHVSFNSRWALLSKNAGFFQQPLISERFVIPAECDKEYRLWTDNYSNLFQILRVLPKWF